MALKQRITDDLKAALLGGDRFVGETLRNLKAAILNEEVAQNKREEGLDDATVEQIIAREVKKRNESIKLYIQGDRNDLAEVEQKEVDVIKVYLPKQLTEDEVKAIVDAAIAQLGAAGMADMGKVIGVVKSKVGNTADGALV
ncbi:MAG TPA: GatB/YqeY domain-containing protein, partial [Candidatus Saccharimonadales bacterium]